MVHRYLINTYKNNMARLTIDTGTQGNPATGDSLRTAFTKVNSNFEELFARSVAKTPAAVGVEGDVAGQLAYDSKNIYVCTANYDGSTVIWKKLVLQSI
jgi:hypothetical protein